jgi:nicotinate dehydrogenase subunit A
VAQTVSLTVNGKAEILHFDDPEMPLLYALRNELGLRGPHFGCGLGQCGACTIHFNGEPLRSCVMPVSAAAGGTVVTLEGLALPGIEYPLQRAFIEEQAAQCGYCINGMIMQAAGLLATSEKPSESAVRSALAANLCKCGTHLRIIRAVMRVVEGTP